MEENTETVKEPQYLIQDLCDQIKQLTKKKLNKIQSEINKSTNLSTGVIRKYEGEISKNKPELFLIGCVEVWCKGSVWLCDTVLTCYYKFKVGVYEPKKFLRSI